MTTRPPTAAAARRVLLILTATRWFPVGLVIGIVTLLPLERGVSLSQLGLILSAQGFVVLALELPTGGIADALGRRPVLLVATGVALVSAVLFVLAQTVAAFVVAMLLQGVYRALDSGPLESWYVDTAQAADPGVEVEQGLSRAGTVLGLSIVGGALASGGLVAWDPVPFLTALETPYWLSVGFIAVNIVTTAVLLKEPVTHVDATGWRRALGSAREAPRVVAGGLGLLRSNRVALALVGVEVFWSVGMISFETLMPVRLSELVGGEAQAGALMGPVSAAAWGLFAAGSALASLLARRVGVAWTAIGSRVGQGLLVVVMGLTTGPIGLVTAFFVVYALHGTAGPVHATLIHRQARPGNRTTLLSMNSMVAGASYSLGLLALGPFAEATSTALAIGMAGAFSVLGAALYLPALRQERRRTEAMSEAEGRSGPRMAG
ncbi:MFS transporter [Phycicoccus sp. CSK15P-2]|uniref:MFS transporter n=1 Tax=Phycicoccus sp. CSK15P-2 TaxID=2807627 RepID=UPI00194DDF33|nr:MFS transporter [Phycicoccus sp. CSK15P-2]MBM6405695.1 MFS transporter [Phycicoccus sp. CSK15P-2]